jgi:membrane protease YdiL (CAAX protease family)
VHDNVSPTSSEDPHLPEPEEQPEPATAQDALDQDALPAAAGEAAPADHSADESADESAGEATGEVTGGAAGTGEDDGAPDDRQAERQDEVALLPVSQTPAVGAEDASLVEKQATWDDTPAAPDAPTWPLPAAEHATVASVAGQGLVPVPWTLRQTVTGTALTLVPWLIFAISAQLAAAGAKQPAPHKLSPAVDLTSAVVVFIVSAVLEAIFLIAPLIYASRTAPPELRGMARLRWMLEALGLRPTALVPAAWATAVAVGVILLSSYAYDAIRQALHVPLKTNADTLLDQAKYEPYTVVATLLVAVLVAPICEEIFFRGFLFPGLARGMAIWGAVVVSALLFGIAHTDVGSFVVLVVIGVVLAVVRWRTNSLWPGVVVHTLNNAIALVGILVLLHH